MEQDYENQAEDEIHQMDIDSSSSSLNKEENDNSSLEIKELPTKETKEFKKGYQLAVLDLQRQIGLRNIDVPVMRNNDAVNKKIYK